MRSECIFLSDCNYTMLYNLRKLSHLQGVELTPCKNIFEMLDKYFDGANAVIIEKIEKFENTQKYLSKEFCQMVYLSDGEKVFDIYGDVVFESVEQFFSSNIFTSRVFKVNKKQIIDKINKKYDELGIVVNDWKHNFIKRILFEMKKREQEKVTKNMIEFIASLCYSQNKYVYDSIRPTLKTYSNLLQKYNICENTSCSVPKIINQMYRYCFY